MSLGVQSEIRKKKAGRIMKILLTGASGFIGNALRKAWVNQYDLYGNNENSPVQSESFETSENACENCGADVSPNDVFCSECGTQINNN